MPLKHPVIFNKELKKTKNYLAQNATRVAVENPGLNEQTLSCSGCLEIYLSCARSVNKIPSHRYKALVLTPVPGTIF